MEEGNSGCNRSADDIMLNGHPPIKVGVGYVLRQVFWSGLTALLYILSPLLIAMPWCRYFGWFNQPVAPLDGGLVVDMVFSAVLLLSMLFLVWLRVRCVVEQRRLELLRGQAAEVKAAAAEWRQRRSDQEQTP